MSVLNPYDPPNEPSAESQGRSRNPLQRAIVAAAVFFLMLNVIGFLYDEPDSAIFRPTRLATNFAVCAALALVIWGLSSQRRT